MREGLLDRVRLEVGDIILVGGRGPHVLVDGHARHTVAFEFQSGATTMGEELIQLAVPFQGQYDVVVLSLITSLLIEDSGK